MTFTPIIGCAIGTGLIYAALIRGVSYAPDQESTMFNYAAIGFAFVETFMFVLVAVAVAVVFLQANSLIQGRYSSTVEQQFVALKVKGSNPFSCPLLIRK